MAAANSIIKHTVIKVDGYEWGETIAEMHRECFPDCTVYASDTPDTHWWVAYWGDIEHPVAFGGIRFDWTHKLGYLCRSGVRKDHRGFGLQPRLIKARVAHARANGITRLITDTVSGNYHSANNLIRAGFRLFNPAIPYEACEGSLFWTMELTPT